MTDQDNKNESEESGGHSNSWRTWIPIAGLGLLFWLWFRDDYLCSTTPAIADNCFPTWLVYTIFVGMFIMVGNAFWYHLKIQSPHIVANNINGSITPTQPVPAGDYLIKRIGCIHAGGISTEMFSNGTIIFPKAAYNPLGSQIAVPCRMEKRPVDALPHSVAVVIRSGKFTPPYWYGDINEEAYKQMLDLLKNAKDDKEKQQIKDDFGGLSYMNPGHLTVMYKEECKLRDKFETQSNQLMTSADGIIDFAARTSAKADKTRSIREKIKDKFADEKR